MRSRPYLFLSVLAIFSVANQTRAGNITQPPKAPTAQEASGTVPFDLYRGSFIVAHASIGPLKNLNFLLDTGTSRAVLDSHIAKKLDLRGEGPSGIVVLGGSVQGEQASLVSFELGPVQRTNLRVITADLSVFNRNLPVRIDGIVGLDVLGQIPFVIDYSAGVIRFGSAPPLPVSIPLRLDRGLAVFDAEVDRTPVHLLFDTGASALILFTKAEPQNAEGAKGDFDGKQVWLRIVKLGPEEFRQQPALVSHNPTLAQYGFDGLVSPAALGISRISVDVQRGVLSFSR